MKPLVYTSTFETNQHRSDFTGAVTDIKTPLIFSYFVNSFPQYRLLKII